LPQTPVSTWQPADEDDDYDIDGFDVDGRHRSGSRTDYDGFLADGAVGLVYLVINLILAAFARARPMTRGTDDRCRG
jgi:hypothetical protein